MELLVVVLDVRGEHGVVDNGKIVTFLGDGDQGFVGYRHLDCVGCAVVCGGHGNGVLDGGLGDLVADGNVIGDSDDVFDQGAVEQPSGEPVGELFVVVLDICDELGVVDNGQRQSAVGDDHLGSVGYRDLHSVRGSVVGSGDGDGLHHWSSGELAYHSHVLGHGF